MAKLTMDDVGDLMPALLVVKMAENPELDELQATEAICRVIDRHTKRLEDTVSRVLDLCNYWDQLSKGETPTTRTIRRALDG